MSRRLPHLQQLKQPVTSGVSSKIEEQATNYLERSSRSQKESHRRGAERAEKTQRFGTRKNAGGLHELLLPPKSAPRRQQNPRSFFRVLISSVRSVKLGLGAEKILSRGERICALVVRIPRIRPGGHRLLLPRRGGAARPAKVRAHPRSRRTIRVIRGERDIFNHLGWLVFGRLATILRNIVDATAGAGLYPAREVEHLPGGASRLPSDFGAHCGRHGLGHQERRSPSRLDASAAGPFRGVADSHGRSGSRALWDYFYPGSLPGHNAYGCRGRRQYR